MTNRRTHLAVGIFLTAYFMENGSPIAEHDNIVTLPFPFII